MPLPTRRVQLLPLLASQLLMGFAAINVHAQAPAMPGSVAPGLAAQGLHLVQRVDEMLYGVDSFSLAVLDRRHVLANHVQVDLNQPRQTPQPASFVVDCGPPLRLARSPVLLTRSQVQLEKLKFEPVQVLDGSRFLAEFACAASGSPGRAAQIARELFDHGGPADQRLLYCDLQPDGSDQTRPLVELRYSDSDQVLSVGRQWLRSGSVTPAEISFGSGVRWHIDRAQPRSRLRTATGELLFEGRCSTTPGASP